MARLRNNLMIIFGGDWNKEPQDDIGRYVALHSPLTH